MRLMLAGLAFAGLAACGAPMTDPEAQARGGRGPLPSGGCYDAPLTATVNGEAHEMTRTGPETFTLSGPTFAALPMRITTDGETAYLEGRRRSLALSGDPASCRLNGSGRITIGRGEIPIDLAIAPAA